MLPEVGILLLTTYVDVRLIGDFRPLPAGTVFMVKRALTDVESLNERFITITPLQYDLTDHHHLGLWRTRLA